MSWLEIKKSIQFDLQNRGLKNSKIRLNALDNIERLLKDNFPEFIENATKLFIANEKNELKTKLSKFKENGRLNSAESSVINNIYDLL